MGNKVLSVALQPDVIIISRGAKKCCDIFLGGYFMGEAWRIFANRLANFHISKRCTLSIDEIINQRAELYEEVYYFKEKLLREFEDSDTLHTQTKSQLVEYIVRRYYYWFIELFSWEDYLLKDRQFLECCYHGFLFLVLCHFLDRSKKSKEITLKEFIEKHSDSPSVIRDCNGDWSVADHKDAVKSDGNTLRKMRNRLFQRRNDYYDRGKWSFMPVSSEYEWALYYLKNKNIHSQETLKREWNLYNEVNDVLKSISPVKDEYDKFLRKLSHITLKDHVELCQDLLSSLSLDKSYFGINLFRFEKQMRYCNMSFEISEYLINSNEVDTVNVINRFYKLRNIVSFPLYLNIYPLFIVNETYVDEYVCFYNQLEQMGIESCLLLLDELIEKEYLGEDWQELFRVMTNQKAQDVLYNPATVKCDINLDSQQAYEKILSGFVEIVLKQHDRIVEHFKLTD